ncbi:MAG: 3-isopropylmalate dehydratase small subunit [Caulobacterales bacterium]
MTPFVRLTAFAAPIAIANIDTDMLFPSRFLKTVSRTGLGKALFHNLRFDGDDAARPDFILNRAPWSCAEILVADENFGCGSSREHAVWTLLDFGIRCIIAPSFAEIFQTNCIKNGVLPICLDREVVLGLQDEIADPAQARLEIDLESCTIKKTDGGVIGFFVDDVHRERLLKGIGDIDQTLTHQAAIKHFEKELQINQPWIKPISGDAFS